MIKYEYKKETLIESTIENRLNDLEEKVGASIAYANTT
jgi:hypothetical protein